MATNTVALPAVARRLSDLLSPGIGANDKPKRKAMDRSRTDEDQELVARTQAGDAGAFDQLVVKYSPRLYGLVYNMTSNDEEFLELTATSSPVREADLSELQRRLNEAMMKLSDEHRAVVTMFHIQGMPHAEISKILRVSEGTVRSRLFYANRQLQNYLDEFRKNPVS